MGSFLYLLQVLLYVLIESRLESGGGGGGGGVVGSGGGYEDSHLMGG